MDVNWNWLIAVLLATLASFISNLGVTLQKLQHVRTAAAGGAGNTGGYAMQMLWQLGLLLVILGSVADLAALSFGPQSLVAPLGSLTLVSNAVYAPLLLGERVNRCDFISIAFIVGGSSIAVIFGSHQDVTYGICQLFGFFLFRGFTIYILIVGTYIAIILLAVKRIELIERTHGNESEEYTKYRHIHRFAYPSISGAIGAQSVLFAKCSVELIVNAIKGDQTVHIPGHPMQYCYLSSNAFVHFQTYLVIGAMFTSIGFQIKWLNDALKKFDSSYCIPVFTSFWIVLSVISGLIFYREFEGFKTTDAVFFCVGVIITIGGVATLRGALRHHDSIQPQLVPATSSEDSIARTPSSDLTVPSEIEIAPTVSMTVAGNISRTRSPHSRSTSGVFEASMLARDSKIKGTVFAFDDDFEEGEPSSTDRDPLLLQHRSSGSVATAGPFTPRSASAFVSPTSILAHAQSAHPRLDDDDSVSVSIHNPEKDLSPSLIGVARTLNEASRDGQTGVKKH